MQNICDNTLALQKEPTQRWHNAHIESNESHHEAKVSPSMMIIDIEARCQIRISRSNGAELT